MPNIGLNIELIKNTAPNAWQDINICYKNHAADFSDLNELENLPFILQLGIFKIYFSENGIDLDFNNQTIEELRVEIENLIINHEAVIKHFS